MKPYIFFLLLIPAFSACEETYNPPTGPLPVTADSVYFQHEGWGSSYYGMYRITAGELLEDTAGKRPGTDFVFDFRHNDSLHNSIVSILDNIPQAIIDLDGRTYSNPSEQEPAVITIAAFVGDNTYSWEFWGIPADMPDDAKAYVEKIRRLHLTMLSTK